MELGIVLGFVVVSVFCLRWALRVNHIISRLDRILALMEADRYEVK